MSIELDGGFSQEALEYKHVHMCNLSIVQPLSENVNEQAVYRVRITYQLFARDSAGNNHYEQKQRTIYMDDYLTKAIAKATAGDPDLLNALTSIEVALANIIADENQVGEAVVK